MVFKHIKVTNEEPQDDGTKKITNESYYEDLTYRQTAFEKKVPTSEQTLLQDTIACLKHVKDGSPELVITIRRVMGDYQMEKRWVQDREKFDRR